jgi:hypothetical protein
VRILAVFRVFASLVSTCSGTHSGFRYGVPEIDLEQIRDPISDFADGACAFSPSLVALRPPFGGREVPCSKLLQTEALSEGCGERSHVIKQFFDFAQDANRDETLARDPNGRKAACPSTHKRPCPGWRRPC